MRAKSLYSDWRFWGWTTAAFILGVVLGFGLCILLGIVLTAVTSYAQ